MDYESRTYDFLIIGSGPAGHTAAIEAAQSGMTVCVVEKDKDMFGGVCLNEGCIPAKSLYHNAKIFDAVKKDPEIYGGASNAPDVAMAGFVAKSRSAVSDLQKGLSFLFKKYSVDIINGTARFTDKETVEVSGADGGVSKIKAKNILIATGSVTRPLPNVPFDGKHVITSSEAIRLSKVPKNILIVGGGAIGTEFASFFNILGSEVSLIEVEGTILPTEDADTSRSLETSFKRSGIKILTSSRVKGISVNAGSAEVAIESQGGILQEKYETVLVAIGRTPCTTDIGLDAAGVKTDDKGFVPVDSSMRTNVENIYAAGDVVDTPMLAHVASAEGDIAAGAVTGGKIDPLDVSLVPNVVYSRPQVASVGMTEIQAKSEGIDFVAGKQFFKANGRAVANSETEGFIKVIADKGTRKLLGAHIIGHEAAELISEFTLAKKTGLLISDIEKTIHAHPTFSEAASGACRAVSG